MIGFEESKNSVIMKEIILFGLFGLAVNAIGQTTCVDPLACNFTELGECEFLDDNGMPCVTEGCAIPGACNFIQSWTVVTHRFFLLGWRTQS